MITNPVQFGHSELTAIDALTAVGLSVSTWSDARAQPVKGQAKRHYVTEQGNECCYCGEVWLTENNRVWDLEHVVPKSLHPDFMFEPRNLAIACPDCNIAKADKETLIDPSVAIYPSSGHSFAVVHPHFDHWTAHISRSGHVFNPKTDKGSWTVRNCNLGRFAMKYLDPSDDSNPSDARFESAIDELTADPATASAALVRLKAYLSTQVEGPVP